MGREKLLQEIISRTKIYYDTECISQNGACKKGVDFLLESCMKEDHSIAFWLHSGNYPYTIAAFTVAILANLVMDETSSNDTVENIEVGTRVLYRKSDKKTVKLEYIGKYSGSDKLYVGTYMFTDSNNDTTYLPQSRLCCITPYYGNSQSLSSTGIGKKTSMRVGFLTDVAKLNPMDVSAIPGLSTVIYMKESVLDDILGNVYIEVDDRKYWLKDLARVTFYTATNEHRKAGNASNNEPAIKVSFNIDKTLELISESQGNDALGFVAFDNSIYKKYGADFERLLRKRKLRYSWLVSKYEYNEWIDGYLEGDNKQLSILPFANGFISDDMKRFSDDNHFDVLASLEMAISEDKKVEAIRVPDVIQWDEYRIIKDRIRFIIANSNDIDSVISFARWSYYMLRFFNNAPFIVEEYEKRSAVIGSTLREQIEENKRHINEFPGHLKEKAESIIDYIMGLYNIFFKRNEKLETIKAYIRDNEYTNVLFVVANNSYVSLLDEYIKANMRFKKFGYRIVTESKIEGEYIGARYDLVVYFALMNYETYHPYNNTLAPMTVVLIYDSQERLFNRIMKTCEEYEKKINKFVKCSSYLEEKSKYEIVEEDDYVLDKEFKDYFIQAFVRNESFQGIGNSAGDSYDHFLEAYKYGQFVDGYQIIFTKNYIAYVLDDEKGAIEKKVDELLPGDELLFTMNDNKTKDLVDDLLDNVCETNEQISLDFEMTESWKEALRNTRYKKNLTYSDLVKQFKKCGKRTSEQTIRSWIDLESHIVGPKNVDDYMYIGKVINNKDMSENPQIYCDAASSVRKTRVKLLKLIKYAMFYDSGKETASQIDSIFSNEIIEKIKEITVIKRLEDIKKIESFTIPFGRANTPIEF